MLSRSVTIRSVASMLVVIPSALFVSVAHCAAPFAVTPSGNQPIQVLDLPPGFAQQTVAQGITGATGMAVAPDGRIFICEQPGMLRLVNDDGLLPEPILRLNVDSEWERGLIGIALDPQFAANGFFYLVYISPKPYPHHVISRFTIQGDTVDPASECILLEGDDHTKMGGTKPPGHQGGGVRFGKDGKLYVGLGEQTAGAPSQRLDTLLGKLLRINPDGSIPADNPLLEKTRRKYRAIWAYGLRNPFALAVQPGTGRIFINDVGASRWEEIDEAVAGSKHGWPISGGPPSDA